MSIHLSRRGAIAAGRTSEGVAGPTPPPPPPPPPTGDPDPGRWFALPTAELAAAERKAYALYFAPNPRSWENGTPNTSSDWWYWQANRPTATSAAPSFAPNGGIMADYGGYMRDRPLPRAPLPGDWLLADMVYECEQARLAGIDGFLPNLLGLTGTNHNRYMTLVQAANSLTPAFPIIPLVDTGGGTGSASPAQAADAVRKYILTGDAGSALRSSAVFIDDGGAKIAVSSFYTERGNNLAPGYSSRLTWWSDLFAELRSAWSIDPAFLSVLLNYGSAGTYGRPNLPEVHASGSWGYGADPAVITAASNHATGAASRGEQFFAPIVWADVRPTRTWYDEALNTGSLRAAFAKARGQNARYLHVVTWNDYQETAMSPSPHVGFAMADLYAWYIAWHKLGQQLPILADCIILSHRQQRIGPNEAAITGPTLWPMTQNPRGNMSAIGNNVEALVFLTEAATVRITVGSTVQDFAAAAGESVWTVALPNPLPAGGLPAGSIKAEVIRNGVADAEITSPIDVVTSTPAQDPMYYVMSSLRSTSTYYRVQGLY